MRVILLAPTNKSLYARLVLAGLEQIDGVDLVGIFVRRLWSRQRIRSDLRREGPRLVQKVYDKLILPDREAAQAENPLALMAEESGLDFSTLRSFSQRCGVRFKMVGDFNSSNTEGAIRNLAPDLIVFTGGGLIRNNILHIPRLGVLNCHSGLLPRYRGMDTLEWSILEAQDELPEVGLSLHFMDAGVDTGPVLMQHRYRLQAGERLDQIRSGLEPEMVRLMLKGVGELCKGALQPTPQESAAGRQYYVIHPRLAKTAAQKLNQAA